MQKEKVGIVGATGYVGQRFLTLLHNHPFFQVTALAASTRSAGQTYEEAVRGRWKLELPCPQEYRHLLVENAASWAEKGVDVDWIFCAVNLPKAEIRLLEEKLAGKEIIVVSNNSAHRWTEDVPVLIPEVNPQHINLLDIQKKRLHTRRGCIVCKPNCSIQAYVSALTPLKKWGIRDLFVSTYQAASGAGKCLDSWPELNRNVIPYISGEEEKSEQEPLKIWSKWNEASQLEFPSSLRISAQCFRVPVQEGHLASVSVSFEKKLYRDEILEIWENAQAPWLSQLPSAPEKWLHYFSELDRPQSRLDADCDHGMGIALGRLREDPILDFKFVCLAHNTIRGAAGGAVLTAELLYKEGYSKI